MKTHLPRRDLSAHFVEEDTHSNKSAETSCKYCVGKKGKESLLGLHGEKFRCVIFRPKCRLAELIRLLGRDLLRKLFSVLSLSLGKWCMELVVLAFVFFVGIFILPVWNSPSHEILDSARYSIHCHTLQITGDDSCARRRLLDLVVGFRVGL